MDNFRGRLEKFDWHRWENLTPGTVGLLLLIWSFGKFGFDFYLCFRQYRVLKQNQAIPVALRGRLNREVFERSRVYRIDRIKLRMFSYFYNACLLWCYIELGILFKLWIWSGVLLDFLRFWPDSFDREIGQTICAIAIGTIWFNMFELPLHIYYVFFIEQKHGFNRQTIGFFIKDHLITNLVEMVIGGTLGTFIVKTVQVGGQYFYLYLWIATYVLSVFFMTIYPTFIAPLFDTFLPLREGRLRQRLTRLATICDFPLDDILIIKESKRTTHAGAYFFGLWYSKRIVIYDNLLIGHPDEDYDSDETDDEHNVPKTVAPDRMIYTEDEIVAIVCHELGHWKHGHLVEEMILTTIDINLLFLVFSYVYQNSILYEAFEFPKTSKKPIFLGLHIIVNYLLDIWNFFIGSVFKFRTRYYEYDADTFTVSMNYGEELKEAIIKMNYDNLSYPYFDWLYSSFIHKQPPELQRIEAIEAEIRKQN